MVRAGSKLGGEGASERQPHVGSFGGLKADALPSLRRVSGWLANWFTDFRGRCMFVQRGRYRISGKFSFHGNLYEISGLAGSRFRQLRHLNSNI